MFPLFRVVFHSNCLCLVWAYALLVMPNFPDVKALVQEAPKQSMVDGAAEGAMHCCAVPANSVVDLSLPFLHVQ